jgi:uncharacterized phage-associated protein
MCTYGFLDVFPGDYDPATDSDAEKILIASSVDDYTAKVGNTNLVQMNLPVRDLEKYGKYSASELVRLTHKEKTPWSKADAGSISYRIIEDALISKYHKYEEA